MRHCGSRKCARRVRKARLRSRALPETRGALKAHATRIVPMKTGYPPEAAIWWAADHGVIQEGAPKQREGSPMTHYYRGGDEAGWVCRVGVVVHELPPGTAVVLESGRCTGGSRGEGRPRCAVFCVGQPTAHAVRLMRPSERSMSRIINNRRHPPKKRYAAVQACPSAQT